MTQVAHSVVSAHVNPFNERFLYRPVREAWNLTDLDRLLVIEQEIQRQAEMIAYSDAFLAAALISLLGIPLAILFTSPKQPRADG